MSNNKPEIEIVDALGTPKLITKNYITYLLVTGYSLVEVFDDKDEHTKRFEEVKELLLSKKKEELPMFIMVNGEVLQVDTIQNVMPALPQIVTGEKK